jgi:Cu2+-exporting ATPase
MVITCPHALGLAIPLVVTVSTALAAKNGFIIRNRTPFENARSIEAVVFDKTGTLTEGRFGVTDVLEISGDCGEETLARYAASLESRSQHPIAQGITAYEKEYLPVDDFRSIPGKGVGGTIEGREVMVVSTGYLREQGLILEDERIATLSSEGKTVVFVLIEREICGAIALADVIRPESKETVAKLAAKGIRCMMLTGDRKEVAEWVAEKIGLEEYFAEVLPQEKSEKIRSIQERGLVVAMVGDGVNDAPALAQADVGIAIGAGTDVALETADIILVKSNPGDVVKVIALGQATYRKMVQNLVWATGYNAFAIPLAAGVLAGAGIILSPAVGALLMSLSTVIVAVNARLLSL